MSSLVLGAFNMTDGTGTSQVMAEGTSWGAPEPIEVAVNTFLQDGAIVVTQGHGNREISVRLRFYGTDLTALAAKEALLFAELEKPNTLTWTPSVGPASVFVVVTSSLVQNDESFVGEVQAKPWRTYTVRLLCEAFVRSASEVTAAALAANGTTTTNVDTGSATTGWTGTTNGAAATVNVVSGAVGVTTSALAGAVTISLTRTGSITTSATKYVVVDWVATAGSISAPRAFGDGTELARAGQGASPTAGYTRTWFGPVAAASIAVLRIDSTSTYTGRPGADTSARTFYVDNIDRTDIKPAIGTSRQLLRSVPVTGSADTQASLTIEHASSGLGDVLAFVYPDRDNNGVSFASYSPPIRQYEIGGSIAPDASAVFGNVVGIVATVVFEVPVSRLPSAGYTLVIRASTVGSPTASLISYTARVSQPSGTPLGPTISGSVTRTLTSTLTIFPIAKMLLPPLDVSSDSTGAVVRITLVSSAGGFLDEAWLFGDFGQLIQVAAGSGTATTSGPFNRVFIDPATVLRPRPQIRVGFAADGSDAIFPPNGVQAWQMPIFSPSQANIFTVTTGVADASVSLRHYPRWHTNPAS